MVTAAFAHHFARQWLAAWNDHDLDKILSHYADDFEMTSPAIAQVMGEPGGILKGKPAVGAYWAKALAMFPELKFELLSTMVGVNTITLYYQGLRGPVAEVFRFDEFGRVKMASAHYAIAPP